MIQNHSKRISFIVLSVISMLVLPIAIILFQNTVDAHASFQVKVTAFDLNVRKAADNKSKIIGMVHQGDKLEIIQTKNRWDQIKLPNNQMGWVNTAYLTPTEGVSAKVEAVVLKVRKNPGLSSPVVGRLHFGTRIIVSEEQGGWAMIQSSSGVQGWVYEYYIKIEGKNETVVPSHHKPQKADTEKTSAFGASFENKTLLQSTPSSLESNPAPTQSQPLLGKTIVLDPGHGGKDDGTTSIVGTHEKSLTLPTAELVKQKLESAGANVLMTRTSDTYIPLQQRSDLSNQTHADAFISFHYNWSNDSSINGITNFYYQKRNSLSLASDILNEVVKTTHLQKIGTNFDNLSVLRNNSQPSTLIELGFLSNKQEDSTVESDAYREKVAQGVYLGLLDFFNQKNK
ncbi:N-acetylmuramoyl-L-alanine amidase [Heyndrickxia acidicola]|uniref:N-acetylmuramoyl-L-alanine amidase n=1 Tax=Heyndrickxia acidicola TaxID=209389 RepID=A0ABU6MH38_9BACI|nr:N-acetylmuramoyl-L-alanine amidase [Heyndrickxia acidicola]MED1203609.1 N-acetylmuramoyl-L-alanine amidase [Heyndrickxia acidicola]